ncbi:MAG: CDP-alcohol phosphatidyltransferase family protein [Pirellula sp.]
MDVNEIDRRPIKSREYQWSKRLAHVLATHGWSANFISTLGMLAGILAGICFAATQVGWFRIAGFALGALCVQLRLIANMLDGMVAIESKTASPVGELFNEVPDRVSDAAVLIGCGYACGGNPLLGYWTTILAIFIAYIRAEGRVAGAPQIYCGPMAKQHRMLVVTVAALASACIPITYWIGVPVLPNASWMTVALVIVLVGELVTVFRRVDKIQRALRIQSKKETELSE